eukprot:6012740-Heterocapsa_arctica.AAC.1
MLRCACLGPIAPWPALPSLVPPYRLLPPFTTPLPARRTRWKFRWDRDFPPPSWRPLPPCSCGRKVQPSGGLFRYLVRYQNWADFRC